MHRAGVCHGDISARNILVDHEVAHGVILIDWDVSIVDCVADSWRSEDCVLFEWVFGEGLRAGLKWRREVSGLLFVSILSTAVVRVVVGGGLLLIRGAVHALWAV